MFTTKQSDVFYNEETKEGDIEIKQNTLFDSIFIKQKQ